MPLLGSVADVWRGDKPAAIHPAYETTDFSVSANREAIAFLQAELDEDDTMFLWGFETLLYFETKRTPQHRYAYSWPFLVTYYDGRHDEDLLSRLNDTPPDVFVVQHEDLTIWVTGREIDSRGALNEIPGLSEFLYGNYSKIGESPRFEYYRLN